MLLEFKFNYDYFYAYKGEKKYERCRLIPSIRERITPLLPQVTEDNGFDIQRVSFFATAKVIEEVLGSFEGLQIIKVVDDKSIFQMEGMLEEKINSLIKKLSEFSHKDQNFNEKCKVHVSGIGLVTFNEVTNLDDCCTDKLQEYLDDDWKIIACCVQPDQRRPDYILGRYKPEL